MEEWDPSLSSTRLSTKFSAMTIKVVTFLISVAKIPDRNSLGEGRFTGFKWSSIYSVVWGVGGHGITCMVPRGKENDLEPETGI